MAKYKVPVSGVGRVAGGACHADNGSVISVDAVHMGCGIRWALESLTCTPVFARSPPACNNAVYKRRAGVVGVPITHSAAMKQQYTVKLSFEGSTRRASFPSQPTWSNIATHIETHFHIPAHHAAAKYTDSDGDEILISTDEELQEYYDSEPKAVKLTVHRLPDASPVDRGGNDSCKPAKAEAEDPHGSGGLDLDPELLAGSTVVCF